MPATFEKTIIKTGAWKVRSKDANGKQVRKVERFTPDRNQKIADTANRMLASGLAVLAPWKHDATTPVKESELSENDARRNLGRWSSFRVNESGELVARFDSPLPDGHPDLQRIGTTVTDVSPAIRDVFEDGQGNRYEDALLHVALVPNPVQHDQDNFVTLMSDDYLGAHDAVLSESDETPAITDEQVRQAVEVLAKCKYTLPADTNAQNFMDRILAVFTAEAAKESASLDGAKEVHHTTALMSLADDNKLVKVAVRSAITGYKARVDGLVASGRLSKESADKELSPLLQDATFVMSTDDAGNPKHDSLDKVLGILERLPKNGALVGGKMVDGKLVVGDTVMGHEVDHPEPETDDDVQKNIREMLAKSGRAVR